MSSEPDKILSRLVVTAITVFLVIGALLAALVVRQFWLQQQIAVLSNDVQSNLEDLEETSEEIQRELSEIRATPGQAQTSESWEEISETLQGVDQQPETLGEDLSDVAEALEPQSELALPIGPEDQAQDVVQDPVDQVFTIFAILVAVASIVIAVLLAMALRVQESHSSEANL